MHLKITRDYSVTVTGGGTSELLSGAGTGWYLGLGFCNTTGPHTIKRVGIETSSDILVNVHETDFVEYDRTLGEPRKMNTVKYLKIFIVGTSEGCIIFFDYRPSSMV